MKKLLLLLFVSFRLVSQPQDEKFEIYKTQFLNKLWKTYPEWATTVGYHNYDSVLHIPNQALINEELTFCNLQLEELRSFTIPKLSASNRTDYLLIENFLKSTIWDLTTFKEYEWNPSGYNVGGVIAVILTGNQLLDMKLKNILVRLQKVPEYYIAARLNISKPTIEHVQLAIQQNKGSLSVFDELADSLKKSKLSPSKKLKMEAAINSSKVAINSYIAFLEKLEAQHVTHPAHFRSFRIGRELFNKKFALSINSAYTADQIYNKALNYKKYLHAEMAKKTIQLWPTYFNSQAFPSDTLDAIRSLIEKISLKHVNKDSFQIAIEKQIPELVAFVNSKDLLYLDPSKPLVIREEPGYVQGVAGASISAPGPYDASANTYYNVGPLTGYSPEAAESYLREYNHYLLQILNIHEAIPGHYAQLVYANKSPSIIKSLLGNDAMVEGWAVYSERMMLEAGYGNNEAEMWLIYYKWILRSTCNTILDYSIHVLDLPKEKAIEMLTKEAFQQQKEAENKWRRATLTQVQLCSYFTGFIEIYEFREEYKKLLGPAFNLKNFHEEFLSYGSSPVKYIRQLMLEKLKKQ